jgi:predicted DNA-binding transcriptional regulator AlpA
MNSEEHKIAFSEGALARKLDLSRAALRKWRAQGRGPRFVKLGKCVRYLASDVDDWLQAHASDKGASYA